MTGSAANAVTIDRIIPLRFTACPLVRRHRRNLMLAVGGIFRRFVLFIKSSTDQVVQTISRGLPSGVRTLGNALSDLMLTISKALTGFVLAIGHALVRFVPAAKRALQVFVDASIDAFAAFVTPIRRRQLQF